MKILLANPPWITNGKYGCRAGSRWPWAGGPPHYVPFPFFLAYATSYLLSKGIDAIFYDAIALGHDLNTFYLKVKEHNPDVILIETSTPSFEEDIRIAKKLSEFTEVGLIGPHSTVFATELIQLPFISYILKGEYELSSYELRTTRRKGIYEHMEVPDEDFDKIPFPYRDSTYIPRYIDNILGPQTPQLPIMESRGCPYQCRFCMWPPIMYNRSYRMFSNDRIMAELEDCVSKYTFRDIFFDSDTFGVCKAEKIIDLSKEVKKLNIPWTVMSRADIHPLEVWLELFHNGCYGFRFGIENFSPRLSTLIGKKEKFDLAFSVIRGLRQAGARIHLCTMGGIPTETDEDRRIHKDALDEMSRMGVGIQKSLMVPFPGTPYYDELKSKGMDFIDDWNCYSGESDNVKAKAMIDRICKEYIP